jgi:hypothetical protein
LVLLQNSIELDEDLLVNSEKSLETLVCMGDSLGVATAYSQEVNKEVNRPSVKDSVVGQDNEVAKTAIQHAKTFKARDGQLGPEDDPAYADIGSLELQ